MKQSGNILFSGVGGQGILLASELTAHAQLAAGFDVKKSEVHGMAQRGGSVEAHLRYGEKVYSPLIEPGTADILVAFEILEAVRYLPYLHKDSAVVVNTQKILPPSVALGKATYPENILDELKTRHINVVAIDAFAVAESVGELRTANVAMVGAMSNFLAVSPDVFLQVIEPGTADILVAFEILEAVRYLPYLHRDSAVVVNTQKILPPAVALGKARYPENILDELKSRRINVVAIDAFAVAESVGELRTANVAMVGAMSNFLAVSPDAFLQVIDNTVREQFRDVNKKAFAAGRAAVYA